MRLTPRPAAAGRSRRPPDVSASSCIIWSRRRRFRFQLPNMVQTTTCPLPPSGGSCDVRARERRGTERQRRKNNCYVTCSRVRSESRGSSGCSCISWYTPREVGWRDSSVCRDLKSLIDHPVRYLTLLRLLECRVRSSVGKVVARR